MSTRKLKYGLTSKLVQNLVAFQAADDWNFYCLWTFLCVLWYSSMVEKEIWVWWRVHQKCTQKSRPKSASHKEIVSKIKEILEGDARFTVRDIARKVGKSLSTVHFILKKHLKVRKISARWVPHLLTDKQKRQQVKVAIKLLQMFPKYGKRQFVNFVTGDETWIHYFEPVKKVSNKIWAMKHSKRPIIAKCSLRAKKVLCAIFFSGEGVTIKVPLKKHHQKVLQRRSTEETEKVLSETTAYHWF